MKAHERSIGSETDYHESQIEDKLKRDAEMKERRRLRAEAKKRAAGAAARGADGRS